jgi:hypothetical protein
MAQLCKKCLVNSGPLNLSIIVVNLTRAIRGIGCGDYGNGIHLTLLGIKCPSTLKLLNRLPGYDTERSNGHFIYESREF